MRPYLPFGWSVAFAPDASLALLAHQRSGGKCSKQFPPYGIRVKLLVGAAGIEPTTSSPPDLRDTTTLRPDAKPSETSDNRQIGRLRDTDFAEYLAPDRYHYATPRTLNYTTSIFNVQLSLISNR